MKKTKPLNEDDFDANDPMVDHFIKESVYEMFQKYYNTDCKSMAESEIGVVEICIGFYPLDHQKQINLAYCVIKATMLSDSTDFKTVCEDQIMPLAIELGVEDAIIQEIVNIKNRRILGSENN